MDSSAYSPPPSRSALSAGTLLGAILCLAAAPPAEARFQKVTEHFYVLGQGEEGANIGALVTDEGVLLIDTPPADRVPEVLDELKRLTLRPVRWVVNTHYHEGNTGGNGYFLRQEVAVIGSRSLRRLMAGSRDTEGPTARDSSAPPGERPGDPALTPLLGFKNQMSLFPGGVEVRLLALDHPAHTAGDVVVLLLGERVLQVGGLYTPGRFPLIDMGEGQGDPLGWFEAMRQAIAAVPLMKSAMPPPKPVSPVPERKKREEEEEEEKTLEELVVVIPGFGPPSNLKEMKELLEAAQKLRSEAARSVRVNHSRDGFLASPALRSFRQYKNLEAFAGQLYDALSRR